MAHHFLSSILMVKSLKYHWLMTFSCIVHTNEIRSNNHIVVLIFIHRAASGAYNSYFVHVFFVLKGISLDH